MKQEAAAEIPYKKKSQNIKKIMDDGVLQGVLKEKRRDHASFSRRIMFYLMKKKMYHACYCLLVVRNAAVQR